MIGNTEDGYTYISKNGGGSSGSKGESEYDYESGKYKSPEEFYKSAKGKRYKDSYTYTTTYSTAQTVINTSFKSACGDYTLPNNNCMRTVMDGLYKANLTEMNPRGLWGIQPNRIFMGLISENKGRYNAIKR